MSDFLIKGAIIVFGFVPLGVLTAGFTICVCYLQVMDEQSRRERKDE